MALSKIQTGLITDNAVNSDAIADSSIDHSKMASGAKIGYIQSKQVKVDVANDATGDNDDQDFNPSVEIDMGTPNSATSCFHIIGKANSAKDQGSQVAVETGGGGSLGIHRKIGTGSWTPILDYGRWADFHEADIDDNTTLHITARDYPNTTEQVQYKLVWSTHRAGTYWGRNPTGATGADTVMQVTEFDTGESS